MEDRGLSRVGRAWQARGRRARVTCSPPAHTLRRTGTPSCSLVALGSSPAHTLRRTARNPHGFVLSTPQSEQVFRFAVSRRRSVLLFFKTTSPIILATLDHPPGGLAAAAKTPSSSNFISSTPAQPRSLPPMKAPLPARPAPTLNCANVRALNAAPAPPVSASLSPPAPPSLPRRTVASAGEPLATALETSEDISHAAEDPGPKHRQDHEKAP